MTQHLTILGEPIRCFSCRDVATVMIRQRDKDDTFDVLTYCDDCWLGIRRGYAPLTAHDAVTARQEAEAITGGSDDGAPCNC